MKHKSTSPAHLTENEARAGRETGYMPVILGASVLVTVAALFIVAMVFI